MNINIPKPCDAHWDKMKIGLVSRHCDLCSKNVIDFRGKQKEDIFLYLVNNVDQKTCGRFTRNQLDKVELEKIIDVKSLRRLSPQKAFLLLALATVVLASCEAPNQKPIAHIPINRIETISRTDSLQNNACEQTDTTNSGTKKIEATPFIADTNEIELTGEVELMGDVILESIADSADLFLETKANENEVYTIVEEMPQFTGGTDSLFAFLKRHTAYPEDAKKNDIEGRIYIQFIVEKDGTITEPTFLNQSGTQSMRDEVIRVIKMMPPWQAGKQLDQNVRVKYALPFNFTID